jgi:hypothetical protein
MKKIPTLFVRDPGDRAHVLPVVHADCRWVLEGEGTPTRKYDGTCIMFDGLTWWARREVKNGKQRPPVYRVEQVDDVTGKIVGWEPARTSAFAKFLEQAIIAVEEDSPQSVEWQVGTYELIGPKINRNPERRLVHTLVRHADAEVISNLHLPSDPMRAHDMLEHLLGTLGAQGVEGIVWHHPDGRMAKLKARDFG